MFIKELELVDNKRLGVRGITRLKVTYSEIQQIILGSNGAGKSSVVRELSPLPAEGNDYHKGGYKRIVIEHDNKEYCLTNTFTKPAGEHSFIELESGEELNQGGTQSVQRALVKEYFNFDDSLFEVLTDQIKFTNMSPIQRREWLTRISGSNLDYAIELFNKLKKAQRNEDAVIKHFTNRLNKESTNIPNQSELDAISLDINNLNTYIEFLRTELTKFTVNENMGNLKSAFEYSVSKANGLAKSLLMTKVARYKDLETVEALKEAIDTIIVEKSIIDGEIKKLNESHHEISTVIKEMETTETSLPNLEADKLRLSDKINELSSLIRIYPLDLANPKLLLQSVLDVNTNIEEALDGMIDNSEGYFEKDKIRLSREQLTDKQNKLESLKKQSANLEHKLDHYDSIESVNCEKCNHVFKPGFNSQDIPTMKTKLMELRETIVSLEKEINSLTEYLSEVDIYMGHYNKVKKMPRLFHAELKPFWDKFFSIEFTKGSTTPCKKLIYDTIEEFTTLAKIEELKRDIIEIEKLLATITKVNSNNYYTTQKLEQIETELAIKNERLINLKSEYDKITATLKMLKTFIDTHEVFIKELDKLTKLREKIFAKGSSNLIEERIKETNLKIGSLVHKQNSMNSIVNIINDIENSRTEATQKNEYLKILIEEINPTTGLIADYFQKFINQFAEQINIVLAKVWEHPIELLPCGLDSNGLNYKFPLRINNNEYGPVDCSKGSNSQISIVNFAFKIVVMVYLGLEDYPLYLDELAPDLDEKHRVNIVHFVRDFVESHRCSQMFMVSHYETGYGAFTNAQILILDKDNLLEIPDTYNTHCLIERGKTC